MQKLQLSIPEPCHENWQNMTATQQGRFCNACAKEVIDFSMMTDREVLNYFTSLAHEKVCGRALPTQLNRSITIPKDPKKRLFWYWNYIVMFFMFFGKANNTKAQGSVKAINQTEIRSTSEVGVRGEGEVTKALGTKRPEKKPEVSKGDYLVATVAGATIRSSAAAKLGNETIVRMGSVMSIDETKTAIYVVDGIIVATSADINPDDLEDLTVLQAPAAIAIYGAQGINGAILITTRKAKEKNLDTVIVSAIIDTKHVSTMMGQVSISGMNIEKEREIITPAGETTDACTVYPNPVQRGSTINLNLNFKQTGVHQIQIVDANGRTIFYKRINAVGKTQLEQLVCHSKWSAGLYFVSLFDDKNKLVNKSSFIIQ